MSAAPTTVRGLILLGLSLGALLAPVFAESTEHPLVTTLRAAAAEQIERGTVPGLVVAVVESGAVLHAEGFGWADVESGRRMTAATPLNVASISKSISAWGLVRFCRDEELSLDAPVPPLIESFRLTGPRKLDRAGVTVRRVLSHSAGLSTPSAPVFEAARSLPPLQTILEGRAGGVPRLKLFQPPGLGFSYSGGGYLLLQLLVEQKTGGSFAGFMAREVLERAGMAASSFRLNPAIRAAAATYYRSDGRIRELYHLPGAAGGLYSTAEDMARWLTLYAESTAAHEALLPRESFRALLEPQVRWYVGGVEAAGTSYALGHATWTSRDGQLYAFHAGGNPGLRAFYFVAPRSGNGLFLAANHDDGQVAFRRLIEAWARHYEVEPPPLF